MPECWLDTILTMIKQVSGFALYKNFCFSFKNLIVKVHIMFQGSVTLEKTSRECPATWITPHGWENIIKLSNDFQDKFGKLPTDIEGNIGLWKKWYDLDAPETVDFPLDYKKNSSPFQILMLLRCFRIDRVFRAVGDYITEIMGEEYIMPPVVSFDSIYDQSSPTTPVIFILSPGSDPTAELMKLGDRY